jgi:hypothetical protein
MQLVSNPEKPQGADIEGNFAGHIVTLAAGEEKVLSDNAANELHARYPWLRLTDAAGSVSVAEKVPAAAPVDKDSAAPVEAAEIIVDVRARKAGLIEALKAKGVPARANMKLDKLEALASEHGVA